jgi:HlyD family secretion protein
MAAGLVVVTGAGVATAASVSGATPRYQVGEVKAASVTQTVESSGKVSAASKATPSFAVSGTVASVEVTVGRSVHKGDTLATLDTTALRADVDSAESALASAKQRLEADRTGQTSVGGGSSATAAAYDGGGSTTTVTAAVAVTRATTVTAAATTGGDTTQAVVTAQDALLAAQKDVDADQQGVDNARKPVDADVTENVKLGDAQKEACDGSGSSSSDACASARADYEASADRLASDMSALDAAISAQDKAVAAIDDAIATLDTAIKQLRSTVGGTGGSASAGSSGVASGGSGTPTKATTGSAAGKTASAAASQPASAAQLASDQAAIDAAEAALTEAKQNLAAATLVSPISGTVAAIGLTVGQSAGSGTITIVGTGVQKISTTVPLADIDLIKTGEKVTIAADGVSEKLTGTVTAIGMLSTTTGSTTTFPVTVALDAARPGLYDGTGADIVITTGAAANVPTVPNSALHAGPRGTYTVTVLKNGVATTRTVTIGVSGPDATQIKSGVSVGDEVVLADLDEQLPSSTTSTTTGRTGFSGFSGFPGGAGGFPGQ